MKLILLVFHQEYVTLLTDMQKLITNAWKIYDKNKELSDLQYWDINNLYGWGMPQKFPVNNFDWIEDTSQS